MYIANSSVELSCNISNGRYKIDGSTGNNHGWLAAECSAGSSANILSSNVFNLIYIFVEGEIAVGEEVVSDFL